MQIDAITPEYLRRLLLAWQSGKRFHSELFELQMVGDARSPSEREQRLQTWLFETIQDNLHRSRAVAGIKQVQPGGQAMQTDFSHASATLEAWSAVYHRLCQPQTLPPDELAAIANVDARQFRRRVESGLELLAAELRKTELQVAQAARRARAISRLPAESSLQLVGVAQHIQRILGWLRDENGPRLISIEGLGGIGKTSLALAATQRAGQQLDLEDIIWISARQQWLLAEDSTPGDAAPVHTLDDILSKLTDHLALQQAFGMPAAHKVEALRQVLPQRPYLVVLDNLETLQDAHRLAPMLQPLTGATRFILTSRHSLAGLAYVQTLAVPELSLEDSGKLVLAELGRHFRQAQLTVADLESIYATVGGLPLALKLLAGEMRYFPLTTILKDFTQPHRASAARFYQYIYRRIWQQLTPPACILLVAMVDISPEGEDAEWLQGMSGLTNGDFQEALSELIDHSLIEISGPAAHPLYRLHRITASLLRTDFQSTSLLDE